MASRPELEDKLTRLGRARGEDQPTEARKQGIKARLFGDPAPPQRLGRFIDLGLLGHGAMGTVRRAYDERLAREVAVKLVRHRSRRHDDRLMREAQALAQLSHPNVVQIYEVGEAAGEIFIAMELVDGKALDEWQQRPHPWRRCLQVYLEAGRGLAAAHEAGLVHRDFKPSNCIRDSRGRVRVLDFGLARAVASDDPPPAISPASAASTEVSAPMAGGSGGSTQGSDTMLRARITADDAVVGTIAFMSPEQFVGRQADAKSDQFSFCVSLYQALYGELPFGKDPRPTLLKMIGSEGPRPEFPSTEHAVPKALRHALQQGLSGDPQARWPSMEALLGELERIQRRSAWQPLATMSVIAGASALLAAPLMASNTSDDPCRRDLEVLTADVTSMQTVKDAFAASDAPYAEDVWNKTEPALSEYDEAWSSEYLGLCRATSGFATASKEQSDRRRCLVHGHFALESTLEVLSEADDLTIANAPEMVQFLPPIEECDDIVSTSSSGSVDPSPDDPRVDRIARDIEHTRVLDRAGRFEEGSAIANEAVASAKELGYEPLLARALLAKGRLLASSGRPREAEAVLEKASDLPSDVRLEALSIQAHVIGLELGRLDDGLTTLRTALKFSREASPRARALAQITLGHIMFERDELDEAQGAFEEALALLEDELPDDDLRLVEPLSGLAKVHFRRGEFDETHAIDDRVVAIHRRHRGENNPETVLALFTEALNNAGASNAHRGNFAEAEQKLSDALRMWESIRGPRNVFVAQVELNLANVLRNQGEMDSAVEHYAIAIDIFEELETNPESATLLAQAHRDLGRLYRSRHELELAEASYRAGIAHLEQAGMESEPMTASLHNYLGHVLIEREEFSEAEAGYRSALALYEDLAVPLKAARTRCHLARTLMAQGQREETRALAERARGTFEKLGDEHPDKEENLALVQGLLDTLDASG